MEILNVLAQTLYVLLIFFWWSVKNLSRSVIRVLKSLFNLLKWRSFHDHKNSHQRHWHQTQISFHHVRDSKKGRNSTFFSHIVHTLIDLVDPDQKKQEHVIYQPIFARLPKLRMTKNFKKKILPKLSAAGMIVTGVILVGLLFPDIALKVIPYKTEPIATAVDESVLGGKFEDGTLYAKDDLPQKNEYLPTGNWLVIPKIGVRTLINEETYDDHEKALEKGVWRVPDFADPTLGVKYPMILVAHKFGYLKWSNDFRHKNSFYNLDKLEIGDTFEVIWDQRRFTYEIYAGEQGEEITDYKADVVLYTCKYLNSPVRIFRYARRVG